MLALKDVLLQIQGSGGVCRFTADSLSMTPDDFQVVVELVRGAYYSGYFDSIREHPSSSTGLVDCIWAEDLTLAGERYLEPVKQPKP